MWRHGRSDVLLLLVCFEVSAYGSPSTEGLLRRERGSEQAIHPHEGFGAGEQAISDTRIAAAVDSSGVIRSLVLDSDRLNFSSPPSAISANLLEFDGHVACQEKETTLTDSGSGNLVLLESHHIMCDHGFFLTGFRMTTAGTADKAQFKYRCCKVGQKMGQCSASTTPARSHEGGNLLALQHHEPKCTGNRLLRGFQIVKKEGNMMSVRYTCCDLDGSAKLGTCSDASTTRTPSSGDARRLAKHKVECTYGMALARWKLTAVSNNFDLTSTCCPVGNQMSLGKRRMCSWIGDPHFWTFDGQHHDTVRPGLGTTYWIVKSRYVNVQAYIQGPDDSSPSLTRGVVVSGRFLQGHRLVVKKDVAGLGRRPSFLQESEASGEGVRSNASSSQEEKALHHHGRLNFGNIYLWDEKPIPWRNSEYIVENLVHLTLSGNRIKANMPMGVTLEIVMQSYYMDSFLWMGSPPGGQVGACGDNNGQNDGNLLGHYIVPEKQNMFFRLNALEGPEEATNKRGGTQSIDQCKGEVRALAERTCSERITGEYLQDYLQACIFDLCFGGKENFETLAQGDSEDEQIARLDEQFHSTRTYSLEGRVTAEDAVKQCGGRQHIVKITSRVDQKAVMEALAADTEPHTDYVWVGARHVAGEWRWHDGQPVCGYSQWDSSVNLNMPHSPWMCLSAATGKWKTCPASEQLNVVCEDHKQYAVMKVADPVSARTACGAGHQMVMPKSEAEQEALLEALKAHDAPGATMWIGASFVNDDWVWEDGSKVCWTNWDNEQPAMARDGEQMFLCMNTATGKWKVCTGYQTEYDVACENRNTDMVCPIGRVNLLDLSLTKTPGKTYSELGGFCYYMGKGKETCHETCYNQIRGFCSKKGLVEAARSVSSCKLVTAGFGGLARGNKGQEIPSSIGCSYADLGVVNNQPVTEVMVGRGRTSPGCDDATAYMSTHRICACTALPTNNEAKYKQGHSLLNGERVRITGKGYDPKKAFKVIMWGTDGKSLRAEVQGTLEFYPFEMRVKTFWRMGKAGLKELADIIWWNFESRTEEWSVDMEVSRHAYLVWVNGIRYPELDVKRYPEYMVSKLEPKGIVSPGIFLIRQEIAGLDHPANMDGADDCLVYPFAVHSKLATMNFTVLLRRTDGVHCIRCEPRPFYEGNHLFFEEGRLTMIVNGANPREQHFDYKEFKPERFYRVQVSYLAEEKVAELYIGAERVQTVHYDESPHLALSENAMLGCSGSDDTRRINGRIDDFSVLLAPSPLRPPRDVCSNYACPNGFRHVPKPEKVRCAGPRCDLKDIDICCAQLGRCSTFECPEDFVKKMKPKNIICLETVCRNEECCEMPGRCSQFQCHEGMVQKVNPELIRCSSKECEEEDNEKCCDHQGRCSDFVCPDGFTHAPNAADMFCSDVACKHTDYNRCCVARAKCSSFACPEHKVHRLEADSISCYGVSCLPDEEELCCEERAKCSTYRCSDESLCVKSDDELRCKTQHCDLFDEPTCCEKRATCQQMTCPAHFIKKPGAEKILCKESTCLNTDYHTCCVEQASCSTFTCPSAFVHKDSYEKLVCKGTECNVADDLHACCTERAACTTLGCPLNLVHIATAVTARCAGSMCTAADAASCCVERGLCTSLACPSNLVHISRAGTTRCEGAVCDGKDYDRCCEERARCDTNVCPRRQVLKHDAKDLLCIGSSCTEEDWGTCCVESGHCASLTCPADMVQRRVPGTIWCAGENCTARDIDTCCDAKAKCTSTLCTDDRVHRHNASGLLCDGHTCGTDADEQRCCTHRKACSALRCPTTHTHREGANTNLLCIGELCEEGERDWNQCCEPRATCDRHECPEKMVLRAEPASIMCAGASCESSDTDTCCEFRGNCTAYHCPTGTQHKADAAEILCKDAKCLHTDFHTCCVDNGRCDAHPCAEGYIRRSRADRIFCPGMSCGPSDLELCCRPVARCNTFNCPDTHVLKKDAALLKCKGKRCLGLFDATTCCEARGTCSRMKCPDKYVTIEGAEKILCADATCTASNFKRCCQERAKCNTMQCPHGYVYKEVPGSIWCAGTQCSEKADRDTCCNERDRCSSMTCPVHYLHVPNASEIFCAGKFCAASELPMCCTMQARCTSMACPPGFLPKAASSSLFCQGATCDPEKDLLTCFDRLGKCDDHECPASMALKEQHWSITCLGKDCTHHECCSGLAKCHTYNCPTGMTLRSNPGSIACGENTCTSRDESTCCEELGKCDKYHCPQGSSLKPNASQILCSDATCVNTDYQICCQESARCSSYSCPVNYVIKPNSSRIFCMDGYKCGDVDTDLCCDRLGSCQTFATCPPNTYRTEDPNALCLGPECHQRDEATCCLPTPRCSNYQCPSKYVLKDDAASIFCDDQHCKETHYTKCCVETAKCSSMQCPPSLVLRPTADMLHCKGFLASLVEDVETCCEERARCSSRRCPNQMTHVPNAKEVMCAGRACTDADVAVCCTDRGRCSSYHCPPGFTQREQATGLYCRTEQCTHDERDYCCTRRAPCATMGCPADHTLKPAELIQELMCRGPLCLPETDDVSTCCEQKGTCNKFQCPEGYVQRHDAASILCSDAACSNTSFQVCCTREAHCDSYTCPEGFVAVDESASVPCHGEVCGDRDKDRCCDPVAPCTSYACPAGYVHQRGAALIHCQGSSCTDMEDLHRCCTEEFMCSNYNCPPGEVRRPNAHTIWCHEQNCESTQSHICCAKEDHCDSFACAPGMVLKEDAHERFCSDVVCTEQDMTRCCETAATCSSLACPANFTNVDNADMVSCHGPTCKPEVDARTCCIKEGFCRKYPCPLGFLHRHDPVDLVCADPPCVNEANTQACCQHQRTCLTYSCPDHYTHVDGAGGIFCRGERCTDADKNLCCRMVEPDPAN